AATPTVVELLRAPAPVVVGNSQEIPLAEELDALAPEPATDPAADPDAMEVVPADAGGAPAAEMAPVAEATPIVEAAPTTTAPVELAENSAHSAHSAHSANLANSAKFVFASASTSVVVNDEAAPVGQAAPFTFATQTVAAP
ncbi:hypothetical protein EV181_007862, partial [Coemansia sp. RSA 532]